MDSPTLNVANLPVMELAKTLYLIFQKAQAFPAFLKVAPSQVPPLVTAAESEIEFAGGTARQTIRLTVDRESYVLNYFGVKPRNSLQALAGREEFQLDLRRGEELLFSAVYADDGAPVSVLLKTEGPWVHVFNEVASQLAFL